MKVPGKGVPPKAAANAKGGKDASPGKPKGKGKGDKRSPSTPAQVRYCKAYMESGVCDREGCTYPHISRAEFERQKAIREKALAKANAAEPKK